MTGPRRHPAIDCLDRVLEEIKARIEAQLEQQTHD